MKTILFCLGLVLAVVAAHAQEPPPPLPVNDTINAPSMEAALEQIFGALPVSHYPSGYLFTKAAIPPKMYFANGVLTDTAFHAYEWHFIQNMVRNSYYKPDSLLIFTTLDSLKKEYVIQNNVLPLGVVDINGQALNDSALVTGDLLIQNHRFVENTSDLTKIYLNRKLFCVSPLNLEIYTLNPQLILTAPFLQSNCFNNVVKMEVDMDDGLGFREILKDQLFQASYMEGGYKSIVSRFVYANGDTAHSRSELLVAQVADEMPGPGEDDEPDTTLRFSPNTEPELGLYPEEFSDLPYNYAPFEDKDVPYRLVEVGVYYACNNPAKKIRKPYLMCGGYNPKNGKSLTPNGYGYDFNTNAGKMLGIHGWRGIYYDLINGVFSEFSKNPQPNYTLGNINNGNNLITRLRNEGYDVLILRFRDGVGVVEHNAFLFTLAVKWINRRILSETDGVENPGADLDPEDPAYPNSTKIKKAKHELVVQGYSAGAMASRMGLLLMEYENQNRPCQYYNKPHRVKTWVAYEHESQGSNTPIGQQMLWEFEKSLMAYPANMGDFLMSFICKSALDLIDHKGISTQNTLYNHNHLTNLGYANWRVDHSPDFDNYFQHLSAITPALHPANLRGYPLLPYRIAVSNGNADGINQTNGGTVQMLDHTSPTSWCVNATSLANYWLNATSQSVIGLLTNQGLPPGIKLLPFRQGNARNLTTWSDNAFTCKLGFTLKTYVYSWHINVGHPKFYPVNHIHDANFPNYQPYDATHGSNLPSHIIFGKGLTKIPWGFNNPLLHRNLASASLFNCNHLDFSDHADGFCPTSSLLDLHLPGQNSLPRLPNLGLVPGNVSGGMNLMQQNKYNVGNNNSPNNNFGFPHLSFPSNHYDYTPFDAIWANTTEDNNYDYNYLHVEDPNPLIGQFLVEETAGPDLYLSNRTLQGHAYTCGGQSFTDKYYADFEARNSVLAGNQSIYQHNFTQFNLPRYERQRTSPGDFVIESEAVVTIRANCANINGSVTLGAGFSSKQGSILRVYTFTDGNTCTAGAQTAGRPAASPAPEPPDYKRPAISARRASTSHQAPGTNPAQVITLFPNPSGGQVFYHYGGKEKLSYCIKDLSGRELERGELKEKIDLNHLAKGVYFITIFNSRIVQTDRIILQ